MKLNSLHGPILAISAFFSCTSIALAGDPLPVNIDTPDGLRLAASWYKGQGGKDSDCVLLMHNYGPQFKSDTGEWENLALALQKEGFSVLRFDFRGHGLNKQNPKVINDPKEFCRNRFNLKAGFSSLNPDNPPKNLVLDVKNFRNDYYPFLINDIAGARYFLDKRNDAGDCNSGRINVIADRSICPLAMYWVAIEFARNGKYKSNVNDFAAPKHDAGTDIMSVVCLSYKNHPGFDIPFNALAKQNPAIPSGIKDKVSVLFIDNEKAPAPPGPNYWFNKWGLAGKKDDPAIRKYATPIPKSDTLSGIDLLGAKKQLGVETEIIEFIKKSRTPSKGKVALNGNDWSLRNTGIEVIGTVPLEDFGVRVP